MLAFCEDVAASGGYWLACAADEIYAHPTSLVGSIGVISQGFGLDGLHRAVRRAAPAVHGGRVEVAARPVPPGEARGRASGCAACRTSCTRCSADWVTDRRGDRLKGGDELFTGEVWTGARALELGLVDGLGTARSVLAERFPDAELVPVEARRPLLARLGIGAPAAARCRSCAGDGPGGRHPRDVGAVRSVAGRDRMNPKGACLWHSHGFGVTMVAGVGRDRPAVAPAPCTGHAG